MPLWLKLIVQALIVMIYPAIIAAIVFFERKKKKLSLYESQNSQ
jgi:hypothetical protein